MAETDIDPRWKLVHRRQKAAGWCGAATIHLILRYSSLVKNHQDLKIPEEEEIYSLTSHDWFGMTNGIAAAYLSRFFTDIGYKYGSSLDDIDEHLKMGNIVVVDWWDEFPPPGEGHYCIIAGYNKDQNVITLVDTSLSGRDIWDLDASEFEMRWFDFEGMRNQPQLKVDRFMMWVNPNSLDSDILSTTV